MRYRHLGILVVLGFLVLPGLGKAEQVTYRHEGSPLFSITFPEGWYLDTDFESDARAAGTYSEGEATLRILEAMPTDGTKLWFGVWTAPKATTLERGLEYVASLDGSLFTDVEASEPQRTSLGGMEARTFFGKARREGEEVEYAVAVFEPRAGVVAVALYVGRPQTWESHEEELTGIVASLQPAGN